MDKERKLIHSMHMYLLLWCNLNFPLRLIFCRPTANGGLISTEYDKTIR